MVYSAVHQLIEQGKWSVLLQSIQNLQSSDNVTGPQEVLSTTTATTAAVTTTTTSNKSPSQQQKQHPLSPSKQTQKQHQQHNINNIQTLSSLLVPKSQQQSNKNNTNNNNNSPSPPPTSSAVIHDVQTSHHHHDLPLHMACERRAPDQVILELLRLFPDATRRRGRGDNFPLHLATHRNLSADVIEALIREYPEALDEVNAADVTPCNIGHGDIVAFQLLRRPTACWYQLMEDEVREEEQAKHLKSLHERVDAALNQIKESEKNYNALSDRLTKVEERINELEGLEQEQDMVKTIDKLKSRVQQELEGTENRLTTVEDDIKASASREYMARAASRAHQSNVLRMQKKTAEAAKRLRNQIEQVKQLATTTGFPPT